MRDGVFAGLRGPSTEVSRSAYLWWVIWIAWLPLFIPVAVAFVQARPPAPQLVVGFAGAALFFALYLRLNWLSACAYASPEPRTPLAGAALWAPIAVMVALSVGLTLWNGQAWGALFIYTSACASGWLPTRQAAAVVIGLALFALYGVGRTAGLAAAISPVVFTAIPGFTVIAVARSVMTIQRLRAEREEMAGLAAVAEERLRIARDLHDLLGHNLSVIALKSELAKRLVGTAPERATAEIEDVERVARTALQEVREAVAGYRQPTLAGELAGVREVLAAAGVAARIEGDAGLSRGLPSAADAALAWAVREGVTNIIRHSRARTCTIRVAWQAGEMGLAIEDDGAGAAAGAGSPDAPRGKAGGNGLRGLAERVEALGGRCESGPRADGDGFRLTVAVPVGRAARGERGLVAQPTAGVAVGSSVMELADAAPSPDAR